MNLITLGWPYANPTLEANPHELAKITGVFRNQYKGVNGLGQTLNLYLSGGFMMEASESSHYPATGDWVKISPPFTDEQNKSAAIISKVLERKTVLSRIAAGTKGNEQLLACNVDKVFIVSSFNSELNLARLQRYLFLAKKGKIEPIVVLSKLDLEENYQTVAQELAQKLNPVKVMSISCKLNQGIDEIRNEIPPGTTGIFVGSSGVGKSTLVNKLLNREAQATQDVREDDDKGKHTTSSRDLFFLENAGMIVDTAGLREVQVFGDQESLDSTFQDISTLESSCRFSNCTHQEEPGCAIQEGLNSGKIDEDDYKNYQKMLRESAYANRRKDKGVQSNSKKKWKKIHMNMRQRKNFEKKQR